MPVAMTKGRCRACGTNIAGYYRGNVGAMRAGSARAAFWRHIGRAVNAPDLLDADAKKPSPPEPPKSGSSLKKAVRAVEKRLSNLQLAISELALIAFFSGVGTIIDQDQTADWYVQNYPDGPNKVLGFLDYHTLFFLQLDHIYSSYYFLGLCTLLAASLTACSRTQQFPLLKVARRWRFPRSANEVFAKGNGETLPQASVRDLGQLLEQRSYAVFVKDGALYAFKGIAGRFAPIAVHFSLLLILFGSALGVLGGVEGTAMIPEGGQVLVADKLRPAVLPFLPLPEGAERVLRVDRFGIDYRADGSIAQYRTTLTEATLDGVPRQQHEIYVNEPMRFGGVTVYQTDWGMSGMVLRTGSAESVSSNDAFVVPLTPLGSALGMDAQAKVYGTFIPLELPDGTRAPRGLTVLARDMESVVFYDSKGQFVGVRRPGSGKPIEVEGQSFIADRILGSSGVQLKADPGVPYVYVGYGLLMITTIVSYLSHSQVWALQEGANVHVGGRTNRATLSFRDELDGVLEAVPERPVAAE